MDLNPTLGIEQQGQRPVLVISSDKFNQSGLALVCPITQGGNHARFAGFAVTLMGTGSVTQGVVMSNQPRTLDLRARKGKFVEAIPPCVTDDVAARLAAIIS